MKLKQARELIAIQRVGRIAARMALAAAQAAEEVACRNEATARDCSRTALEDWKIYLREPGFSPELSQSLSQRLIEREKEAEDATLRARLAVDLHARSESSWQRAEAGVRSSELRLQKLARKVRRRRDEDALNRSADLVTYGWRGL